MAGIRSGLVPDVELVVLRRLVALSSSLPPGNPNHGVDFSAILAAREAPSTPAQPNHLDVDTIDLVDSPARPVPLKRPVSLSETPILSTEKRQRTLPGRGVQTNDVAFVSPARPSSQPSEKLLPAGKQKQASAKGASPSRGAVSRNRPSVQWLERFRRAMQHPIYLIERKPCGRAFVVMGASGGVYDVQFRKCNDPQRLGATEPVCSCPDFVKRSNAPSGKGRGPCKHIIFVMNKVLGVHQFNKVMYQVLLLESEFDEIMHNAPSAPSASVVADESVQVKFRESQEAGEESDADCPICFEPMETIESKRIGQSASPSQVPKPAKVVSCSACRKKFHAHCIEKLASVAGRSGLDCPLCRAKWRAGHGAEASLNLAHYSSKHQHPISLQQMYPDSHQYIGRGRGFRKRPGRGGAQSKR